MVALSRSKQPNFLFPRFADTVVRREAIEEYIRRQEQHFDKKGYVRLNVYGVTRPYDAARLPMQVSHETPHAKEKLQPIEGKESAKATLRKQRLKIREIAEQ